MTKATTCQLCQRPSRDGAYVCDACGDQFAGDLRDLGEWLGDELDVSLTGTKGVVYKHGRLNGGGAGGDGLRVNWPVADLQRKLLAALLAAATHCSRVGTRSSDYGGHRADVSDIAGMATWLRWRVDGLCLDPEGPRLAERLMALAARARLLVDRPPDHQYLGQCEGCERGRVYAIAGELTATCEMCRETYDAAERRDGLINSLLDRLVTAAEVAQLSAYLGLRKDREQVRKRVNQWHRRGRIEAHVSLTEEVTFRFGEVWLMLQADEHKGRVSA